MVAMVKKRISELVLQQNEKRALEELKKGISDILPGSDIILFGSRARSQGDVNSDVDVLILVDDRIDGSLRNKINDISYGIELDYDVVFGKIIQNRDTWNSPLVKATPLHMNIDAEGIAL